MVDRAGAIEYFVRQYQLMLEENLDDYIRNFDLYVGDKAENGSLLLLTRKAPHDADLPNAWPDSRPAGCQLDDKFAMTGRTPTSTSPMTVRRRPPMRW